MLKTLAAAGLCCLALLGAAPRHAVGQGAAGMAPQSLEPGQMTADQIAIVLRARGYSDLGQMSREGGTVTVADAKRYGEATGPLKLDAKTGQVRDERPLSEGQAQALLRDRGYSDISEARREGDTILASAQQAGSRVNLRVDARSGTVSQR